MMRMRSLRGVPAKRQERVMGVVLGAKKERGEKWERVKEHARKSAGEQWWEPMLEYKKRKKSVSKFT